MIYARFIPEIQLPMIQFFLKTKKRGKVNVVPTFLAKTRMPRKRCHLRLLQGEKSQPINSVRLVPGLEELVHKQWKTAKKQNKTGVVWRNSSVHFSIVLRGTYRKGLLNSKVTSSKPSIWRAFISTKSSIFQESASLLSSRIIIRSSDSSVVKMTSENQHN